MMKPYSQRYNVRHLFACAIVALLGTSGCASSPGLSTPVPARLDAASATSSALRYRIFTAGTTPGFLATGFAVDLAEDTAGAMWFTDAVSPAIGRISPEGKVTEFLNGLASGAHPYEISRGPDGNMWFTDSAGVAVGRITPQGAITEYSAPQYTDERAQGLAFGADGRPWFVTFGPKPLLVHVTKQGTLSVVHLPPGLSPDGSLVSDRGGNLWFVAINLSTAAILVERRTDGTLVKIPTHLVSMAKPCCPNLAPKRLVIGPNGNPWFTSLSYGSARSPANFIGRDEAGRVTLIRVTNKGVPYPTYPSGLAAGSAKLWFTSGNPFLPNGALTQMDTQGNQVAYQVPYNPLGLTVDGNGHPWFTTLWSGLPSQIVEATVR